MSERPVSQDEVISMAEQLPSFPSIITEILASLDDPEANLKILASFIQLDPIITARVLSVANLAAAHTRRAAAVKDIYTATSLIGMSRVREMALISSIGGYLDHLAPGNAGVRFWQHSVSVGVCAVEVALHIATPVSVDMALISGLLHDVGQLWLYRFRPNAFLAALSTAQNERRSIEQVELEYFRVNHCVIGRWLANHWALPSSIGRAIDGHHNPDAQLDDPIVPIVHIAEVLCNALDLGDRPENRVSHISTAACSKLGLTWDDGVAPLFGRIDARSRHANAFFHTPASASISAA